MREEYGKPMGLLDGAKGLLAKASSRGAIQSSGALCTLRRAARSRGPTMITIGTW